MQYTRESAIGRLLKSYQAYYNISRSQLSVSFFSIPNGMYFREKLIYGRRIVRNFSICTI